MVLVAVQNSKDFMAYPSKRVGKGKTLGFSLVPDSPCGGFA